MGTEENTASRRNDRQADVRSAETKAGTPDIVGVWNCDVDKQPDDLAWQRMVLTIRNDLSVRARLSLGGDISSLPEDQKEIAEKLKDPNSEFHSNYRLTGVVDTTSNTMTLTSVKRAGSNDPWEPMSLLGEASGVMSYSVEGGRLDIDDQTCYRAN